MFVPCFVVWNHEHHLYKWKEKTQKESKTMAHTPTPNKTEVSGSNIYFYKFKSLLAVHLKMKASYDALFSIESGSMGPSTKLKLLFKT